MKLNIHSVALNRGDTLFKEIEKALAGIASDRVCGIVFCGIDDEVPYHQLLGDIKFAVHKTLHTKVPVTLIPQYLLPYGGLSLHIYTLDTLSNMRIEEQDSVCYGVIESEEERLLFIEGVPASDFSQSVYAQSSEVFAKLDTILHRFGFEVDDIVRQWNYIGNIVAHREGKQNYQEFNDVRSEYYGKCAWANGYPAATGIGASYDGIIVGGIAFKRTNSSSKAIYPIDNPLQVAAHIYSKRVLIDQDANAIKSTPKFERAKLIESENGACCFVSGTAAIRGEDSVDPTSAKLQTIKTIENIQHLVSKDNLVKYGCKPYDLKYRFLHIYIKSAEDYEDVKSIVEEYYPNVATLYSIADVCRSELLVEIEGILTQ